MNTTFRGVIDTTLRDGQQSPLLFDSHKYRFHVEDKIMIFESLVRLGVRHFEFFSPVVSKAEFADVQTLQKHAKTITTDRISFLAHCRCHETDIRTALDAGFDGLNLYIGINELARQHSHGFSMNRILAMVTELLERTRQEHPDTYIRFSIEDCFRTPLEDMYEVYDLVATFVDTLGMPDTVGSATPDQVKKIITALKTRYPDTALECHFHNDRGFALINALTAVQAGAEYIDTSVWGLAERSGITSVTGLLLNLFEENPEYVTQYNLALAYPVNVTMASILNWHVPYTEPVSLTNRTHTAGVHQKAVLSNKEVYENHQLDLFGVSTNQMLLEPLSGWNLIHYYLNEIAGVQVDPETTKEITHEFKQRVHLMGQKTTPEAVLRLIVAERNLTSRVTPPEALPRIENLNSSESSTAESLLSVSPHHAS